MSNILAVSILPSYPGEMSQSFSHHTAPVSGESSQKGYPYSFKQAAQ